MAKIREELHIKGLSISSGVAIGRVCLFDDMRHRTHAVGAGEASADDLEHEKERFAKAVEVVGERLEELRRKVSAKIGDAEAGIFVVQKMILEDPALREEIVAQIEDERLNAEAAVTHVLDAYERRISEVDNEYMRERATDIGEIKRRLVGVLSNTAPAFHCSNGPHCKGGEGRIIVAEELTPTLTMELDAKSVLGFVTERGGTGSHAAILARAFDIPAVSGLKNVHNTIKCGTEVLINGDKGEIVIWPCEKTIRKFCRRFRSIHKDTRSVAPVEGLQVLANISLSQEAHVAKTMQAEGIGLYRTEFEILSAGRCLDEDEQYALYSSVVKEMDGHRVTFRMLDLGGDKTADFLDLPKEENPHLGFRGSRVLMSRPDLFRPQARALARTSQLAPINVMYPMISNEAGFLKLRNMFIAETEDISAGEIRHGLMFEVPAACLIAHDILKVADFGSIGTNDLIQYLLAVDRDNELVADDYSADHPALWVLLRQMSDAARETGKPLTVCGEVAANPKHLDMLIDAGLTRLSVNVRAITKLRMAAQESK